MYWDISFGLITLNLISIHMKIFDNNIICIFLQKDDIMLHFTLSGSSDITGCHFLIHFFVYFFVYLILQYIYFFPFSHLQDPQTYFSSVKRRKVAIYSLQVERMKVCTNEKKFTLPIIEKKTLNKNFLVEL